MPGENLTRQEADHRAATVGDIRCEIALDLTEGPERFTATTTIRFAAEVGASTFVDLVAESVLTVRLNGADLTPAVWDGSRIALGGLGARNELTVVSVMRYSRTGEGLHRFADPVDGKAYCYTQMAVPDARRVFAVFDQPDLKGRFELTITAPAGWIVLSNQPGAAEAVGDHDALWRFAATPPIASYLVALVAGRYVETAGTTVSANGRTIPMRVLGRASLAGHLDADGVLDTARRGIAFYERAFGVPFPFEKYDQVFVPEYNWGAMENPGAVTFNESFAFRSTPTDAQLQRRDEVVLHELAHMWFGDLVTMRWWDDLWLNESFATFMATLALAGATRWHDAWAGFAINEKSRGLEQDQLPSTHPVLSDIRDLDDVGVNFDGITYSKGASVLQQLAAWVGLEPFLAGVGAYLRRYAWGSATLADLLQELETTSGRDLAAWSAAWLESAGPNTLVPELEVGQDGSITVFSVRQTAPAAHPVLRPHRIAIGGYDEVAGRLERVLHVELDVAGERTAVPQLSGLRRPALLLLNDDDLTFAKIRIDPASLSAAADRVNELQTAVARTVVWGALWDAARDAEARPRDFVSLVATRGLAEPSSALRAVLLRQATLAAELYVAPEARAQALTAFADALLAALDVAVPGSDLQRQLAPAFARVVRTPAQLDALGRLAAGDAAGLELGPELRWSLLTALVAGGAAGEREIAAGLDADRTARGEQAALQARAALPTATAKAGAWASAVSGRLPNEQVRQVLLGFARVADPALLTPFIPRYAAEIADLWTARPGVVGRDLATGLFPLQAASGDLAGMAAGWLAEHPDEPAPLRRIVAEQLDRTRRAIAARHADAR